MAWNHSGAESQTPPFGSITEHGSFWRLVLEVHAFQGDFSKTLAERSLGEREAEAPRRIAQRHNVTKVSKEHDVKHEEQESVDSLKFVVELTSDRASADAELSAVILRQVEQRELCQGRSAQG